MKRIFFCCFLLWSCEVSAQEDLTQGVWKGLLQEEIPSPQPDDKFFEPVFSGGLVTDLNYDHNYRASNSNNNYNDSLLRSIFASKLSLNKNFSLQSVLRLDDVDKYNSDFATQSTGGNVAADYGKSQYFQNEALRVEEITANYTHKNFTLLAGKFTPNFGENWQWGRGIWSNNLSNNYRQTQKLGAGMSYKIGDRQKTGQYNFGFSTFINDHTGLSNSAFSKSDPYNKSTGTPGDASGLFQSFAAAMDILFDFGEREKLSYHFSYISLGVNSKASPVALTQVADQKGYAAAMKYRYPVAEKFLIDALLEYVRMKNIGGNSNVGEQYYTASLVGEICRNWNITLANTTLVQKQYGANGFDQSLSEVSLGYSFDKTVFFDKILMQIGYKSFRTNYKTSIDENNSIGVLLRYIKSF